MPRFRSALVLPFVSLLFAASAEAQTTIRIPADQPNIQAGINVAHAGDTVLVSPGTYFENLDFHGKAITVTSSGGAASTIIDGGNHGTTVSFISGETRASVLSSLTITHGGTQSITYNTQTGSGVVVQNSAPTILNNIITQNYCQNISSGGSAPLIQGNTISSSLTPEKCGVGSTGGIYIGGNLNSSSPAATNGTAPQIIGNTIENNTTGQLGDGGGDGGAGIAMWGGSPLIQSNIIRNNRTNSGSGGAINVVYGSAISIVDNLIYKNYSGCGGGAIGSEEGGLGADTYLLIANNTILGDTGGVGGGYSDCRKTSEIWTAFYDGGGPSIKFVNNIIDANQAQSPALDCGELNGSLGDAIDEAHQSLFDHNLLYNTGESFFGSNCFDSSNLHGNKVENPKFVNESAQDFHLQAGSPAIDTGNGSVLANLKVLSGVDLVKDIEGNTREQDATGKGYPIIDIGAYEFSGVVNTTPTRIVLSSSVYSGAASTGNTLAATFSSTLGVPTGAATFFIDNQQIGVANIVGGVAKLANVAFSPGPHTLYASYDGQGSFQPAVSVIIVVDFDRYATMLTTTNTPNPSLVGQMVTFTIHISSADTGYVPTPVILIENGIALATLLPDATGNASFVTSMLALGTHYISASYAGDTQHASASNSIYQQVISGLPTSTTVSGTPNPSSGGQSVTFTAHVTSSTGTPTGSVTFTDGASNVLATVPLTAGLATTSTAALSVGSHTITAIYSPAGTFSGSIGTLVQVVQGLTPTVVFTANPTTVQAGDTIALVATVTGVSGHAQPTGTITFYDGATALPSSALNSAGTATISVNSLLPGTHLLTCVYGGDQVYASANCNSVSVSVQAPNTSLILASSANPTPALTPVTFTATLSSQGQPISGNIQFTLDGQPQSIVPTSANGNASVTLPLSTGSHTVRAVFATTLTLNGSSASVTEVAQTNPTSTVLIPPAGSVYENQAVNMAVQVKALTGSAQPYGTLTLLENATVLATQSLAAQANGAATVTLRTLTPGIHVFTALYAPTDANFSASTSTSISVTVLPQTYTLTSGSPSMTVRTEYRGSMEIDLTSVGGWNGTVRLDCNVPLPPVATCEVPTMTLMPNSSAATTLFIDTDAVLRFHGALQEGPVFGKKARLGFVVFAGLLLPLCFVKRRRTVSLLALGCVLSALASLTGCSGKYPDHTPPGTYTLHITATGTSAGAASATVKTLPITLIVTE